MRDFYEVTEIFGPTMQGEGPFAGQMTVFVRLHYCDSTCSFCDTRYSWDKNHSDFDKHTRMSIAEIVAKVKDLYKHEKSINRPIVTISGGNPYLQMKDDGLLQALTSEGFTTQVETQGTLMPVSVLSAAHNVVSPKPPSSGQPDIVDSKFIDFWAKHSGTIFKIVVFSDDDFSWACDVYERLRQFFETSDAFGNCEADPGYGDMILRDRFYLQAGTDIRGDAIDVVLNKYRWLVDRWLKSGYMPSATVLPQMHVLVWGRRKGV